MSNRDGFASGFIVGTLVGGAIGGVFGVLLSRRTDESAATEEKLRSANPSERSAMRGKNRQQLKSEEGMEVARRSLEDKIAQLNEAIDDVREQLSNVNGTTSETRRDRAIADDV